MPEIRPAHSSDAAALARLTSELGYGASPAEISARLMTILTSERFELLVAEGDTGLLGWVVVERRITLEFGERAELTGLVVSRAARRTGVGRGLVVGAESWARRRGLASIFVRSDVSREASHPFYESLGYHRKKTQHVYEHSLGASPGQKAQSSDEKAVPGSRATS